MNKIKSVLKTLRAKAISFSDADITREAEDLGFAKGKGWGIVKLLVEAKMHADKEDPTGYNETIGSIGVALKQLKRDLKKGAKEEPKEEEPAKEK